MATHVNGRTGRQLPVVSRELSPDEIETHFGALMLEAEEAFSEDVLYFTSMISAGRSVHAKRTTRM